MALKAKTPPPLEEPTQQSQQTHQSEAIRFVKEGRLLKVDPEIDQRLNKFIEANPALNDYYKALVAQEPERAVRSFMLNKMFKHEALQRRAELQAPQAKQWLEQQPPAVKESLFQRLQKINPFYQQRALVQMAAQEKARLDFAPPAPRNSQGMSV